MAAPMAGRWAEGASSAAPGRARCRCGHLPTHHMVVVPLSGAAGARLEASGPCAVCGEAACRHYSAGAPTLG
ncbi:MAG TPA: hypothetical protein VEL82_08250 [Thermoplasmata archaeon]|nr:hypothetical protein [Thermoplasmata archaeon]